MSATIVLFGLTYFLSAILFAPMPQAETRTIKIAFCVLYIIGFLLEQLGVFSDSPLKALLKGRAERRSKNKLEKLRFEYHDLHRAADEKKDEFEQRAGGLSLRIAPIEVPPAEMQADLEAQAELEVEANTQAKDLRLHPTPSK
ncbi:MAG: hypothetical protein ABH820_01930 [Patescibacteria group bacterium]|nr:hypothetical protein [Patescibacteria group bacterium]MBU2509036.1 hypothetical protein [Patescibacteria group bacterium]